MAQCAFGPACVVCVWVLIPRKPLEVLEAAAPARKGWRKTVAAEGGGVKLELEDFPHFFRTGSARGWAEFSHARNIILLAPAYIGK